ncbi:MAG: hypothetical protein ABI592_04740 [Acidobacteriota bacterium]
MTRVLASGALSILLAAEAFGQAAPSPPAAFAPKCADAEHRRLDFWAGDWEAYEVEAAAGAGPVARARIEIVLGGCALRETYEQSDGLVGQSLSAYDASRSLWHQTWVTNRGALLQIDGRFEGDRLTIQGAQRSAQGREDTLRALWKPQNGGVRETAEISSDGGKTWRPLFDILFRRHGSSASPPS